MLQEEFNRIATAIVAAVRVGELQQFKNLISLLTTEQRIHLSKTMCQFLAPHAAFIPFLTLVNYYDRQEMLSLLLKIPEIEAFAPTQCNPSLLMQYNAIHNDILRGEEILLKNTLATAGYLEENLKKRKISQTTD